MEHNNRPSSTPGGSVGLSTQEESLLETQKAAKKRYTNQSSAVQLELVCIFYVDVELVEYWKVSRVSLIRVTVYNPKIIYYV